jgi:hypothetical protein
MNNYSNGRERIVLIEGDDGYPVKVPSYYFDGKIGFKW